MEIGEVKGARIPDQDERFTASGDLYFMYDPSESYTITVNSAVIYWLDSDNFEASVPSTTIPASGISLDIEENAPGDYTYHFVIAGLEAPDDAEHFSITVSATAASSGSSDTLNASSSNMNIE